MNKHNYYSYLISIYIMLIELNIRKDQKLIKMHLQVLLLQPSNNIRITRIRGPG